MIQIVEDETIDEIGGKLWESAPILASEFTRYLLNNINGSSFDVSCKSCRILELGSGTGYVGIAVAQILRQSTSIEDLKVYVTDMEPIVPLMVQNIKLNNDIKDKNECDLESIVYAKCLDWTRPTAFTVKEDHGWDFILISDCVYWTHLHKPLLNTLLFLCPCEENSNPVVFISYKLRSMEKEYDFFHKLGSYFSIELLQSINEITVVKCRRKKKVETGVGCEYSEDWWQICLGRIEL